MTDYTRDSATRFRCPHANAEEKDDSQTQLIRGMDESKNASVERKTHTNDSEKINSNDMETSLSKITKSRTRNPGYDNNSAELKSLLKETYERENRDARTDLQEDGRNKCHDLHGTTASRGEDSETSVARGKEDSFLLGLKQQMTASDRAHPVPPPSPTPPSKQPTSSDGSLACTDDSQRTDPDSEVLRPVRTCLVLCLAFFFVYTANLAIQNLQSSLHQTAGLGMTSLAVLYGSIILFGTLSPLVIRFLTAKWTLVLAFVCHLLYTLSNFYPSFPTLLSSSLLLGIMAGPMWTAQGLYSTATGMAYAAVKQKEAHEVLSLFNGVFFAFYEATQISGNFIASAVLWRSDYNTTSVPTNHSKICGAAVCPGTEMSSTQIQQPERYVVYVLLSVYLACNVMGLLLTVVALPRLPRNQEIQVGQNTIGKSTMSCLSMLLVPKMLLVLPLFMAQAMNSGILLSEYNEKFVSCAVGIRWVGYVMTVFGAVTAAQAVGLNYLAKFLGRRPLFVSAALADISVNVTMLAWDPTHTSVGMLFILPCVSGFAEGIFQAQFNSLVAMLFPERKTAAFATYHTSKATAFTLTFVMARFLCLNHRLYVSLALCGLGLCGYAIVEVMLHKDKVKTEAVTSLKVVQRGSDTENAATVVRTTEEKKGWED